MAEIQADSGFVALIERCLEQTWASRSVVPGASGAAPLPESSPIPAATATAALNRYLGLLVEWNRRMDLTAARSAEELVDLFVADAALLARLATRTEDWVDIGTGAGAPGLPLQLLRPELKLTLVEPRTKRTAFLRTAVGALGLSKVVVRRAVSREVASGAHGTAVSRATFEPSLWLAEGARLARNEVWVLLAQAEPPSLPGWQADCDLTYRWPLTGVARRAVRFVPNEAASRSDASPDVAASGDPTPEAV